MTGKHSDTVKSIDAMWGEIRSLLDNFKRDFLASMDDLKKKRDPKIEKMDEWQGIMQKEAQSAADYFSFFEEKHMAAYWNFIKLFLDNKDQLPPDMRSFVEEWEKDHHDFMMLPSFVTRKPIPLMCEAYLQTTGLKGEVTKDELDAVKFRQELCLSSYEKVLNACRRGQAIIAQDVNSYVAKVIAETETRVRSEEAGKFKRKSAKRKKLFLVLKIGLAAFFCGSAVILMLGLNRPNIINLW